MIKINIILQDNFKLLGNSDSIDNQNEVKALTTDEQEKLKVEEIKNELKQFVKQRTQVNALIRPVQIVIVNDCGNTFMPIAKFIVQEFSPLFDSILMKSHLTVAIVLALHFFNPRSSKW